jgi:hypothetical protein
MMMLLMNIATPNILRLRQSCALPLLYDILNDIWIVLFVQPLAVSEPIFCAALVFFRDELLVTAEDLGDIAFALDVVSEK